MSLMPSPSAEPIVRRPYQIGGLVAGIAVFLLMLLVGPQWGMTPVAWKVAAVATLMALWWISEAMPISATAFLPLVVFPLLGVASIKSAAAHYAHPVVFLIFGGFVIATSMEKWNLHRRIALNVLSIAGARPDALIAGFMAATAGISMWVSNTATTIMMLPIGISVIELVNHRRGGAEEPPDSGEQARFATALALAIAYAASIGGVGTLIGTPPNAIFAAYMNENYGVTIGFAEWMLVGFPLSLVLLVLAWAVLTRFAFPVGRRRIAGVDALIAAELERMGPISRGERLTAIVFACVAAAWIFRPLIQKLFPGLGISDTGIAIAGALSLFLIPVDARRGIFLLDREWAARLPWNVLILFGGGLSLAAAISESGLAEWLGEGLTAFHAWPIVMVILAITALVIFLTELTSNTATAIVFLPLTATLAGAMGVTPVTLMVPAVVAASCAFMLPVATPPNAIIFASGRVTIPQMARAGLFINFAAIFVITAFAYVLVAAVFG